MKFTDDELKELLDAFEELTDNADMASQWVPHVLLIGAVDRARSVLAKIKDPPGWGNPPEGA